MLSSFQAVIFWSVAALAEKYCYTPSGADRNALANVSNRANYLPCNNIEGVTLMCCGFGSARKPDGVDICLTNGLCHSDGRTWRESCTDPTWQDPACVKLFVNGTGYQNGAVGQDEKGDIWADVTVTSCKDGSYCFGEEDNACCLQGQGVFLDSENQQVDEPPQSTTPLTSPGAKRHLFAGAKGGITSAAGIISVPAAVVLFFYVRKRKQAKNARDSRIEITGQQVREKDDGSARVEFPT